MLVELAHTLDYKYPPSYIFFAPNHGKSPCDARAATVKTFLKRQAIRGNKATGPDGIASLISNADPSRLSQRNATALGSISHSELYDWTAVDALRSFNYYFWTRVVSSSNLSDENPMKEAYQIACFWATDNDVGGEMVACMIEPFYEFKKSASMTITKEQRKEEKKAAAADAPKKSGGAKRSRAIAADDDDDDDDNEGGVVNESDTEVVTDANRNRLRRANVRVAIRMVSGPDDADGRWYAASGRFYRSERIPFSEHKQRDGAGIRLELFRHTLQVVFDDADDPMTGEHFDVDDDMRLLKE